jgi:hypothetical protein
MTTTGLKGYSQPRDRTGKYALWDGIPWTFQGHTVTVFLRLKDTGWIDNVIPNGFTPHSGLVRLTAHHMTCTFGRDWDWALRNPNLSQFHEAVVACEVEYKGRVGHYDPFCWTYSDAEMAEAREGLGWPMRYGEISQTNPPVDGWSAGCHAAVIVSRYNRAVYEMDVKLEKEGDLPAAGLAAEHPDFFTCRMLPRMWEPGVTDVDVAMAEMGEFRVGGFWHGPATVLFTAPELEELKGAEVLGGRVNWHYIVKTGAKLLDHFVERDG